MQGIPDSPEFKAAFVIVTAVYIAAMIVIFILYRRSLKRLSEKRRKLSSENADLTSRQCTRRQAGSETESDQ